MASDRLPSPSPSQNPTLRRQFEREVRTGVEAWARAAVRTAAQQLGGATKANAHGWERAHATEALALLDGRADALVAALVRAVHEGMDGLGAEAAQGSVPTGSSTALTLIDESQIDEDIAIARAIQSIESEAEWELRHLASLCSGLAQRRSVETDANPLSAALCAGALRRAVQAFGLGQEARLLLLRETGAALGRHLRPVYAALNLWLEGQGVRAAEYVVRQTESPAGPSKATPPGASNVPTATRSTARRPSKRGSSRSIESDELGQLLERARRIAEKTAALERAAAAAPSTAGLRLFDEPKEAAEATAVSLDAVTAERVMRRLLEQLGRHASMSDHARSLLRRLEAPALRIAAAEPQLWSSPDHPWWALIDRIVSLGAVYEATAPAPMGPDRRSLADVVEQLVASANVDRQACEVALEGTEAVATTLLDERKERLLTEVGAIQAQADRTEIEIGLRNQLVDQMRAIPVAPALQQFLLGPWVLAMTDIACRQGIGSPALAELGQHVEELLEAVGSAGRAVSPAQQRVLLNRTRAGLVSCGLAAKRIEAELEDLAALLREPQEAAAAHVDPIDADDAPGAASSELMAYAGMPTVPIDMVESQGLTDAVRDRLRWLDSLAEGDTCRLFVQGHWVTAQLTWISGNRNLFVFTSRQAGRTHSMTARVLERLRGAGLSATIERGRLLAQAMDTMLEEAEFAAS